MAALRSSGDDGHAQRLQHFQRFRQIGIAFAPAQITVTGVCASSFRSAEMSKLNSAPRWTPPMPPVAKTLMPARWAQIMVAATVVAPVRPVATPDRQIGARQLHHLRLRGAGQLFHRRIVQTDAGIRPPSPRWWRAQPWARISTSTLRGHFRVCGKGMPWVMIVDSSATMGRLWRGLRPLQARNRGSLSWHVLSETWAAAAWVAQVSACIRSWPARSAARWAARKLSPAPRPTRAMVTRGGVTLITPSPAPARQRPGGRHR